MDIWRRISRQNATIYASVFKSSIPEGVGKVEELQRGEVITVQDAIELKQLSGFLVDYPFKLLHEVCTNHT